MRRWRYRKVTPEMKRQMVEMRSTGVSYAKIAETFRVNEHTVRYHLNPKEKERVIELARKRHENGYRPLRNPATIRQYMRERYRNDPEFRKRIKAHMKKHSQKKRTETRLRMETDPQFTEDIREYWRQKYWDPKKAWKDWHNKYPGWRP